MAAAAAYRQAWLSLPSVLRMLLSDMASGVAAHETGPLLPRRWFGYFTELSGGKHDIQAIYPAGRCAGGTRAGRRCAGGTGGSSVRQPAMVQWQDVLRRTVG